MKQKYMYILPWMGTKFEGGMEGESIEGGKGGNLPFRRGQTVVVVVVYFILSRLLYLAFSANLGLLCMPHPGMGPLA